MKLIAALIVLLFVSAWGACLLRRGAVARRVVPLWTRGGVVVRYCELTSAAGRYGRLEWVSVA